ncbi:hypothetical protein J5868_03410 [Candidatus Saccharibacteria bacterium]|nr:hypothetical protein [Candidatus Saccharibacteria bacterium]MBQ1540326.1 hypothetical protein [Candidatus Saccharibacteria bacterium]
MDEKQYLNQISSTVRPTKKSKKTWMSSPFFKVGVIGVVGFILIVIIGSLLGGGKGNFKSQLAALQLHLDNTSSLISTFQKSVKSSDLRSTSASLYSVLTNTSRDVASYLSSKYKFKVSSAEQNVKNQAKLARDGLEAELMNAKINGLLDRVFAMKMKYEVSTFMAEETEIYNASGDESLRGAMNSSYNSLKTLYEKLDSFSETK